LLDEPTAFLDYLNRQKLIELLVLIAEKQQKTIILSSHDIDICINNALEFLIVSEKKIFKTKVSDKQVVIREMEKDVLKSS
ncbi:MAG: hypothetical protein EBU61_03630, partial [Crocinitomicaceae bacterium]|nr:hypothetical protein [Crocinitomicaceae bacterium]